MVVKIRTQDAAESWPGDDTQITNIIPQRMAMECWES